MTEGSQSVSALAAFFVLVTEWVVVMSRMGLLLGRKGRIRGSNTPNRIAIEKERSN